MKATDLAKQTYQFIVGFNNAILCFAVVKETTKMREHADADDDCDFKLGWLAACDELDEES